jgi:threonylcarbamoyladenosine tRNA methylthiotransferase MtaB
VSVETITLGCRLNFAESEAMRRDADQNDDLIIVNSCAVTAEAVRQTRQAIRRARRERPSARIMVTGCAAQLQPEAFAAMPEVDRVEVRDFSAPLTVAAGFRQRVRSFVAVQTGCDHRCTFCTIWQARGPSRSLPVEAVIEAIAREIDAGAQEIVLTGVDITSYDQDGVTLGTLCQRILRDEPRLQRLRLSSLDSVEIDPSLFELVAGEPRLLPHFHLSLQAGDDMILKRMKRRHSRADAVAIVDRLKAVRSDTTIGADLIAGFPTETEDMAANSLRLLEDCEIIAAHVFPFSPREGTPAARMPQLEREVVKARAARLREAAAERRSRWLGSLVGTRQRILIENHGKGHSDGFAPVHIDGALRGDSGMARIVTHNGDHVVGVWA